MCVASGAYQTALGDWQSAVGLWRNGRRKLTVIVDTAIELNGTSVFVVLMTLGV